MARIFSNAKPPTHTCAICLTPLPAARIAQLHAAKSAGNATCGAQECHHIALQYTLLPQPLIHARVKQYREQLQKQQAQVASNKAFEVAIDMREKTENNTLLAQVITEHNNRTKKTKLANLSTQNTPITIVTIPSGPTKTATIPKHRRKVFLTNLRTLTETVFAKTHNEPAVNSPLPNSIAPFAQSDQHRHQQLELQEAKFNSTPTLKATCDQLCTLCKGGCCTVGGNHAFITEATIQQLRETDGAITQQQIYELYAGAIGRSAVQDSCIYHSATGCNLPRNLRSDVCNVFYCDALLTYQQQYAVQAEQERDLPLPILAIQRANNYWNRFFPDTPRHITQAAIVDNECCVPVDFSKVDIPPKRVPSKKVTETEPQW